MAALLLLAPALGLAANAMMQLALSRMNLALGPIRVQFVSFALGGVVTLLALGGLLVARPSALDHTSAHVVQHLLIYACFGFVFFNVINANVSSLRVRILKELLARYPAPMPDAELLARYNAREIVLARLARLQAGGQIEAQGGRYYLRKGGIAIIGEVFAGLRRLLLKP